MAVDHEMYTESPDEWASYEEQSDIEKYASEWVESLSRDDLIPEQAATTKVINTVS